MENKVGISIIGQENDSMVRSAGENRESVTDVCHCILFYRI